MMLNPEIKWFPSKCLMGLKMEMSLTENKTGNLWKEFMTLLNAAEKNARPDLYSLQIYSPNYFKNFNPSQTFMKWALVEETASHIQNSSFEKFHLQEGVYAVFEHKGHDTSVFQRIYAEWLPQSAYVLDDRPHFELLGEKYNLNDSESEEQIFIPVRQK